MLCMRSLLSLVTFPALSLFLAIENKMLLMFFFSTFFYLHHKNMEIINAYESDVEEKESEEKEEEEEKEEREESESEWEEATDSDYEREEKEWKRKDLGLQKYKEENRNALVAMRARISETTELSDVERSSLLTLLEDLTEELRDTRHHINRGIKFDWSPFLEKPFDAIKELAIYNFNHMYRHSTRFMAYLFCNSLKDMSPEVIDILTMCVTEEVKVNHFFHTGMTICNVIKCHEEMINSSISFETLVGFHSVLRARQEYFCDASKMSGANIAQLVRQRIAPSASPQYVLK